MTEDILQYTNEEITLESLEFAKKLGTKKILLLFTKHKDTNKKVFENLTKKSGLSIRTALIVKAREAQKYSKKYSELFATAERENVENNLIKNIYDAELLEEKDRTHQRGSGLNHILTKIISEKKKKYYFNMKNLLIEKDKAKILGRMQQNKKFFTKYKTKYDICSFAEKWTEIRSSKDRKHFLNNF